MSTNFPGYRGRTPSEAAADGVPLSEAEMVAFELAARRRSLDTTHRAGVAAGTDCPYHPGWGHGLGQDPRYADSDWRQQDRANEAAARAFSAEVDELYDPTR